MSYYRTCHICGSNLDPNEACDCEERGKENALRLGKFLKKIRADTENEQIEFDFSIKDIRKGGCHYDKEDVA